MPENKILKEFLEITYDKEKNYDSICSKIKGEVDMKKKWSNIAAVLLMILVIGVATPVAYAKIVWNIEYEKYQNRNVITRRVALDEESKEGYSQNIDMDYMYQDEIGIKVKSLMLTNDYCEIGLDFKFSEETEKEIDKDEVYYGFAIYDENNNIYAIAGKTVFESNYQKKLYEELGKKNIKEGDLSDSAQFGISGINITSIEGFPKSRKIYIRIFNVAYSTWEDNDENLIYKDIPLSGSEWQFEINVPQKFYQRTAIQLISSKEVEGVIINKAELTETSLAMKISIRQFGDFLMSGKDMDKETFAKLRNASLYISDEDDNIYEPTSMSIGEGDEISARFGIGKDNLDKKIFLNVSLNDIQEKIELIQK